MAKIKKVAKYQNAPKPVKQSRLSDKDSMNFYANRYDELSASGVKKMGSDKRGSAKDLKAADEARKNEIRLAKKIYGVAPSNKTGGVTKKKTMKIGGKIRKYQNAPKPIKKSTQKLPLGASSASAEAMYEEADRLNRLSKKMTGIDYLKNAQAKKPSPRQQSDSLRTEADRKTKATGGVPRSQRLKIGGKMTKAKSGMKMSKMSKKK